ncbi:MAG: thiol reductase thioredoxin [Verrucomicrobia bacterium]|nr:thiol reductase thioredoxin [Verrucomicrobiota bacterium]
MNKYRSKSPIAQVVESDFDSEVLKSKKPVLVAFGAPWSRPCRIVEAVLNQVAAAWADAVKIVKVNADDNPDLSMWYEIQSIPTLLFFVDGSPRGKLVGTASKEAILAKLQSAARGGAHPGTPETNQTHEERD